MRVEYVDNIDADSLSVDCSVEYRSIEKALYQTTHGTTGTEPLRTVPQLRRHKVFEAWRQIVRKCDQRSASDYRSGYAALVSNTSDRSGAKDVEQFNNVPRTSKNEANKYESWFGKISHEMKTLAITNQMLESFFELQVPWCHDDV